MESVFARQIVAMLVPHIISHMSKFEVGMKYISKITDHIRYLECVVEAFKGQGQDPGSLHSIRRTIVLTGLQQTADDRGEIAQVATEQCFWGALAI